MVFPPISAEKVDIARCCAPRQKNANNTRSKILLGVIHILRNHQGGGGFRNDYANVIFALSNAEFHTEGGRRLETDKN